MQKPILKNHVAMGDNPVEVTDVFWLLFPKNPEDKVVSVYFSPLGRVMPLKFFAGKSWQKALFKHVQAGHIWLVRKKVVHKPKDRIKAALAECPKF